MERYIGLDVHAASCTLAVISRDRPEAEGLSGRDQRPGAGRSDPDDPGSASTWSSRKGTQSAWLYEILSPHVDEVVVAGVTKSRGQKSDRRDAYGLAEKLRTGTRSTSGSSRHPGSSRCFASSPGHTSGDQPRSRPSAGAPQECLPFAWDPDTGPDRSTARHIGTVARSSSRRAPESTATRLYEQLDFLVEQKEQAEAGSDPGVEKAPDRPDAGDGPGDRPDSSGAPLADRGYPTSLPHQAAVLELLRARESSCARAPTGCRRPMAAGSGPGSRRPGAVAAAQPRAEGHLQGRRDDGRHAGNKGSDLRRLRADARRRDQAESRQAHARAHHRSDGLADVEGRGGVHAGARPASQRVRPQARRRPLGSEAAEEGVVTRCRRAIGSEVSIHVRPGPGTSSRRPHG